MDLQKIRQAGCALSVHPGVGVAPGGFTSPGGGGGAIPRLAKWLEETFYEVVKVDIVKFVMLKKTVSSRIVTKLMDLQKVRCLFPPRLFRMIF